MTRQTLKVEGMSCGHCKMSVEKAVNGVAGVQNAAVDLEKKEVVFEYDGAAETLTRTREAIQERGYEVV